MYSPTAAIVDMRFEGRVFGKLEKLMITTDKRYEQATEPLCQTGS